MKRATTSLLLAATFLGACATSQERRIERDPAQFSKLSSRHQALVRNGEVREGMSREAVYFAWGRPDIVRTGSRSGKKSESWAYTRLRPTRSFSSSYRYAGYSGFYSRFGVHPYSGYCVGPGWNFGGGVDYTTEIARTVQFSNGRVVAWER
ncbi:MAG: hypothetical protein AAF236_08760 [Verrucomicrobiota bacterium]